MPIITEITEVSQSSTTKLKQWMHLNHILNCKTRACKTYKMVQAHLQELQKVNGKDIILIPFDYKLGSYSDAVLTIICFNSERCTVCLKLLDHLSCHKRYCDCNNYKDICNHQLQLRRAVEKFPISGNSLNKYNSQCSNQTKERIKSLGKYHYEAVRIMQGLKDVTQVAPTSSDNGNMNTPNEQSVAKDSGKIDLRNSVSDSNINNDSTEIVRYQPQTSPSTSSSSYISSDDAILGSLDGDSESDTPNFGCFSSNLGILSSCSSGSSDFGLFGAVDSDSSFDYEAYRNPTKTFIASNNLESDNSSTEDSSTGPNISVSGTDHSQNDFPDSYKSIRSDTCFDTFETTDDNKYSTFNSSNGSRKRKSNNTDLFSDESFIDCGSDSSDNGDCIHQPSKRKSRKSHGINMSLFSDESMIEYSDSDDESLDITNANLYSTMSDGNYRNDTGSTTGLIVVDITGYDNNSHKDKSEVDSIFGSSLDSQLQRNCNDADPISETTGALSQDTSGIASQSTDIVSDNKTQNVYASTPLHFADFHCQGHSSDCWYCGIGESISKSDPFMDTSLSHFNEISHCSNIPTPKRKRSTKKRRRANKKLNPLKKKTTNQPNFNNISEHKTKMNCSEYGPSTSGSTNQRNTSNKTTTSNQINNLNGSSGSSKTGSFGEINYPYVRNVLAQQNAQTKCSPVKQPSGKYKKKMKLYDTSSWIESANYFQLFDSKMERY